ncbi:hypothetical protein BH11ARM2_BH11ARM2_08160 [soil metagenome]
MVSVAGFVFVFRIEAMAILQPLLCGVLFLAAGTLFATI